MSRTIQNDLLVRLLRAADSVGPWALYLIAALAVALPLWVLARRRAGGWFVWEYVLVLVPGAVWLILYLQPLATSKDNGNLLVEPILCGLAAGVSPLARIVGGKGLAAKKTLLAALGSALAVGCVVLVTLFVPAFGFSTGPDPEPPEARARDTQAV
jgi:hypothetical protein